MGSIDSRLSRLEEAGRGGRCPECGFTSDVHKRPMAVVYEDRPEKSFDSDPYERCPRCDQQLYVVVHVVYDSPPAMRGEGA